MTEQALQSLGDAALAANQPGEAVAALDAYPSTSQKPALLFLRAEAREQAGKPLDAVADYQTLYMRFAVSEQGRESAKKLEFLRGSLGANFPALSLDQRLAHAATSCSVRGSWRDARNEYAALISNLSGADRERAQLRVLECGMSLGAGPSEIIALQVNDPDVDAERFESLAEHYRTQQQEAQMIAAVESAVTRARLRATGGRSGAFPCWELLLGAARSRPRVELLQAPRGIFPEIYKRDRSAVACVAWTTPS